MYMRVKDKLIVSESNMKEFNLEVMRDTNLLASLVYQDLREITTGARYRAFNTQKLAFKYFQGNKHGVHNILRIIRNLASKGYIDYQREFQNLPPKFRILKDLYPNADIDLRWMSVSQKFSGVKLLVLTTLEALEHATTKEIGMHNPELSNTAISRELVSLKESGIVTSVKANKKEYAWSINFDNITILEGFEMTSNLSRLLELKEAYAKKAEEAMDAVKFYEEQITEAIKLQNKKTKEME